MAGSKKDTLNCDAHDDNVTDVIDHRDDDAHDDKVLQLLLIVEMIILVIMMATLNYDAHYDDITDRNHQYDHLDDH